jgi:hypothetical protein
MQVVSLVDIVSYDRERCGTGSYEGRGVMVSERERRSRNDTIEVQLTVIIASMTKNSRDNGENAGA